MSRPPAGHDMMTRQYLDECLDSFATELRGDMAELRAELRGEMGDLRGGMSNLRGELRSEVAKHARLPVLATVTMNVATMGVVIAFVGAG